MIMATFSSRGDAEAAVRDLELNGINSKDISIIMKNPQEDQKTKEEAGDTAERTLGGAVSGGAIGGLAGLIIGLAAFAVPGIGSLLIGGPVAGVLGLTGAGATAVSGAATGALAGGIIGALARLGVAGDDAQRYESDIKSGAIFMAIPVSSDKEKTVLDILERNVADKIRTVKVGAERTVG